MKENKTDNISNKSAINNSINNTTTTNLSLNADEPFKSKKKCKCDKFTNKIYSTTSKLKKKIIKNKKYEISAIILSILSIIFYLLGLEGCYGDEVYCLAKLGLFFYIKIIVLVSLSSLCFCTVLILMTFGKVSTFHLFYMIPSIGIAMLIDQGSALDYHGYFNTIGFIALLIIFYPICSFIYLMIRLINKKKYIIYIPILSIILCLFILFIIYIKKNTRCDNWDIGLNNTRIYNSKDEYACQMDLPKSCYLNIVTNKLNFSNIIKEECSDRNDKQKRMMFEYLKKHSNKYINSDTKRIGYPNLNKGDYPQEEQNGMIELSRLVLKNLVDMDNLPPHITGDKIPETYVDFSDDPDDPNAKYGKIVFNLTKNETLVQERKKNEENNEVIFNNIIVLFIDALSRAHINRKMPKFKKWAEKLMQPESEDFINYQFIKFHSLGVHTPLNIKPAMFGESVLTANGIHVVNYLKEKGFITGQVDDYCSPEPYQLRPTFDHSNVTYGYFDHELISLFCEPNYFRAENPFPLNKGNCAIFRRCLYGLDTFDYLFNYSKLFWRTYNGSRRFLRFQSQYSHEATGELINLMDGPLTKFLDDLMVSGDLNDTILFLFSDHGNHMAIHLSLLPTDDLGMEKIMPFFFFIVPKKNKKYQNDKFLDEFYENLYKNQQSFVTCYDIHDTIIHTIFNQTEKDMAPFSANGTSLFKRVDDKHRTCDDYPEIMHEKSPGTLTCNCINNK